MNADHTNDIRSAFHTLRGAVHSELEKRARPLQERHDALASDLPEPVDYDAYVARVAAGDDDAADELVSAELAHQHAVRVSQVREEAQRLVHAQIRTLLQSEDRRLEHIESNAEAAMRVANQIAGLKLAGREPGIVQTTLDATAGAAIKAAQQLAEKYGCTTQAEQLAQDLQELLSATAMVRRVG